MLSGSVSLFLNLPDCSAKSKQRSVLWLWSCFPFVLPPSIVVRLLKRSPIAWRSWRLGSRRFGQSMKTWTSVSIAPHSHLSLSEYFTRLLKLFSQLWPILSWARRPARCRERWSYSFRTCRPGTASSISRKYWPLIDLFHSVVQSRSVSAFLAFLWSEASLEKRWLGTCPTEILASRSASSFPLIPLWLGIHLRFRSIWYPSLAKRAMPLISWIICDPGFLSGFARAWS